MFCGLRGLRPLIQDAFYLLRTGFVGRSWHPAYRRPHAHKRIPAAIASDASAARERENFYHLAQERLMNRRVRCALKVTISSRSGLPTIDAPIGAKAPPTGPCCCRRPTPDQSPYRFGSSLFEARPRLHDAIKKRGIQLSWMPRPRARVRVFYGFFNASSVASSSTIGLLPSYGLSHSARFLPRYSLRNVVISDSFTSSKLCCLASRFSSNLMMW